MTRKIITLLTDFGLQDIYVGVLKGVISQINPDVSIIDITHQIPPQDLYSASYCLGSAFPYFPPDTIYIGVVDPGVGSNRKAIAIQSPEGSYFIGPDNGIFTSVINHFPQITVRELTNSRYWLGEKPSATFHGRDIFAPVAAYLAKGIAFSDLGELIPQESLIKLPLTSYRVTSEGIRGVIQYMDNFGNIITNIPGNLVQGKSWRVKIANIIIQPQVTYSKQSQGKLLAVVSSDGWIEIAVNGGNAQQKLGLNLGDEILVEFR